MATQYAFGKTVTNGLVLSLDAADKNSYPGSGTTWTDLSGNGNTATLTNTPPFYNSNLGNFAFNGSNQYASILTNSFPFGASAGTISAWARTNSTGFSWIVSYGTAGTGQSRFLGVGNGLYYFGGYNGVDITASGVVTSTWFNITGVYTGTQALLYINGSLVAGPTSLSWNTVAGNAQIGRQTNNAEHWNGDVASVQIYNRALSAAEILQNYDAQKSRFNYRQPIVATGGTITESGGYRIHTFNSSDNFVVTSGGVVDYLVVAGGGGGGNGRGGGGGGGGMKTGSSLQVTAQTYAVTIGAGGAASSQGGASSALGISTTGGGRGGSHLNTDTGGSGGSGGGAAMNYGASTWSGGSAVSGEGSNGGSSGTTGDNPRNTGGGGGKSAAGTQGQSTTQRPNGGAGAEWPAGSGNYYAGGGGGARGGTDRSSAGAGTGGIGGGGTGGGDLTQTNGTANTGGGGGGSEGTGASGGSGIVIIRYLI